MGAAGVAIVGAAETGVAGGFTATGIPGTAAAIAGFASVGGTADGLATTGPAGGLAAIAGAGGVWGTMAGAGRGRGTILRGAGFAASTGGVCCAGAGTTGGLGGAGAVTGAVVTAGLVGATGGAGGRLAASASCSLRSCIAFNTSPGFDTRDQSIFGLSASPREVFAPPPVLPPRLKCARTRSASSPSSELEWVFFSVTPTSVNTSRIALLLTSSSRAKSLIRTLLIRPFCFFPKRSAVHSNLMPMGVNPVCIIP